MNPVCLFILSYHLYFHLDLNATDNRGNTPLHTAVKNDQPASITFLLDNGADSTILNDDQLAPIHLAVDANARKALKVGSLNSNYQVIC